MWQFACSITGLNFLWVSDDIPKSLHSWLHTKEFDSNKALPLVIIRGAWLARNHMLFQNKFIPPRVYATKSMAIMEHYSRVSKSISITPIIEEFIDHSFPWCLFNGATQGLPSLNRVVGILFISEHPRYHLSAGLGSSTNNQADLKALRMILHLSISKEISKLQ